MLSVLVLMTLIKAFGFPGKGFRDVRLFIRFFVLCVLLSLTFLKAPQIVSLWLAVKACW